MASFVVIRVHVQNDLQYVGADVYPAASRKEANRLVQLWEDEGDLTWPIDGGYPDKAYIVDLDAKRTETAADKIREVLAEIADREKEDA